MSLITNVRSVEGIKRMWPTRAGIAVELVDRRGCLRAGLAIDAGVAMSLYAYDPVLGTIPVGEGELVVHRRARRAVVVADRFVTKHVRKGGERIACNTVVAGRTYRSRGLAVADVTDWSSAAPTYTRLPDRFLDGLGDEGLDGWKALARAWQSARDAALEPHTGAHEARIFARWAEQARIFDVIGEDPRVTEAILDVSARLIEDIDTTHVVSHADLYDGQLLWDGTSLGVINLDGARMAEPALDLMNLRAHAELHHLRGHLSAHSLNVVIGHIDDVASCIPTTRTRLEAYLQASRLRLISVYSFCPGANSWLGEWMDHALSTHSNTH